MMQQLVFSRGNLIGDDHPLPTIEKVELSVTCSVPSSITLIANEPGMWDVLVTVTFYFYFSFLEQLHIVYYSFQ